MGTGELWEYEVGTMIKLSNRLKLLASYVPQESIIADIGTDHGYLPVYLVLKGICPRAVAADINQGPLEAARSNILEHKASGLIELRLGNGLEVLQPGEVETIVIAGMGGGTIRDILTASPEVAGTVKRLILQPMADEMELRQYLLKSGWTLREEDLLLEDGRLYVVMVAERGYEWVENPVLLELGPRLLEKKHPLLGLFIAKRKEKYHKILAGLAQSTLPEAREKAEGIRKKLQEIEGVEACL